MKLPGFGQKSVGNADIICVLLSTFVIKGNANF